MTLSRFVCYYGNAHSFFLTRSCFIDFVVVVVVVLKMVITIALTCILYENMLVLS